ncbi:MOSC domain-containing protein [Gottfriedia solisilvae]|uniref:Sulfurase n=1 Tax=Gottfriedia solisilvae TaxID=1516104 RepID=A0A8J3AXG0_9BACI|nr:MOSC domain-containing protein [Gottfriedia solisilvae]GGI18033.1 sulfurase [Gottfriedia solisilvae]
MVQKQIELINFAVGLPSKMHFGEDKEMVTAICKEKVEECYLSKEGFRGDGVANLKYHGGPDRAVCVYPYEHYSLWEKEFQVSLPPAAFGENITVTNMLEQDVCIGDVYQIGDAIVQVTQGRIPCSTITNRTNVELKRIVETGFTGYFCRVIKEGIIRKDSKVELLEQQKNRVSILYTNEVYFHNPMDVEGIKKILEVPELAEDWRSRLTARLEKNAM